MNKQNSQQKQPRKTSPLLLNEAEEILQSDLRGMDTRSVESANFKTELEYEGYERIEDYDNNAFDSNTDELESSDKELNFEDRVEQDNGEENLIDPQNHSEDRRA